jgi:hypothetical protein
MEIINEKTLKVIRLMYQDQAPEVGQVDKPKEAGEEADSFKFKLKLKRMGVSIINSGAREIAYIFA